MGEDGSNSQQYQFLLRHPRSSSNKPRLGGGEIVEVQGGHIIRSTGRKDRHSKVCTAKGPRDRRVRLSAHTAIQFYDVQDRLGYDRPSKAVDWLIKNAKPAIDELAKLPPWTPSQPDYPISKHSGAGTEPEFLPPSLDSDAIADTIKSFFPASPAQDLRLSLQSFQHPILHHNNNISTAAGYDASPASWSEWGGGGGFMSGVPFSSILGQNSFASQRGPLQSSGNSASGRAWIDPMAFPTDDGGGHGFGGFSGFRIPARIQGEEDHDGGGSEKLSCASRR